MPRTSHDRDRAQTGVDFIVGAGVFLLTVGFVFGFVPGMLTPFGDDTARPLVADRIAAEIAEELFATGPGTSTLDAETTRSVFDAGALPARLSVPKGIQVNVTVERNVADSPSREIVRTAGTTLAVGPTPPSLGASVSTATRMAALDGEAVVVVIRAW